MNGGEKNKNKTKQKRNQRTLNREALGCWMEEETHFPPTNKAKDQPKKLGPRYMTQSETVK